MDVYFTVFGFDVTHEFVFQTVGWVIVVSLIGTLFIPSKEKRRENRQAKQADKVAKLQGRADELEAKKRIASLEEELRQEKRKSTAVAKRSD